MPPGFTAVVSIAELRSALAVATNFSAPAFIFLPAGQRFSLGGGALVVKDANVTIVSAGSGAVLDGENRSGIVIVTLASHLVLRNIRLADGFQSRGGGLRLNGNCFAWLDAVTFSGCKGSGREAVGGGMLLEYSSSATLNGCAFENCTTLAPSPLGTFWTSKRALGGAVSVSSSSTVSLIGTAFVDCSTSSLNSVWDLYAYTLDPASRDLMALGGALFLADSPIVREFLLLRVVFRRCGSYSSIQSKGWDAQAGAVFLGSNALLTAMGSSFDHCTVGAMYSIGGALLQRPGSISLLEDVTFSNCRAAFDNALYLGVMVGEAAFGGAIRLFDASIRMSSVSFYACNVSARYSGGGALLFDQHANAWLANVSFEGCFAYDSIAGDVVDFCMGGAIFVAQNTTLQVTTASFTDCHAWSISSAHAGTL